MTYRIDRFFIALLVSIFAIGFAFTAIPEERDLDRENIWVGEYPSLKTCLAAAEQSVRKWTGKDVRMRDARISKDKPDEVIGWLDFPKNRFKCELKRTGTKGTYWEGLTWIAEKHRPGD